MVTSNVAVLKGCPKFTKLIESSVYDTNLAHYISMVLEELKWAVKEKQCFNVDVGKVKIDIPMHEIHQQIK